LYSDSWISSEQFEKKWLMAEPRVIDLRKLIKSRSGFHQTRSSRLIKLTKQKRREEKWKLQRQSQRRRKPKLAILFIVLSAGII
jgi:hypothetical protein